MRAFLLAAALPLLCATRSSATLCSERTEDAPCTPDPGAETNASKREILDLIKKAKALDTEVARAKQEFLALRKQGANIDEQLAACKILKALTDSQNELFQRAMERTTDLYNIHPENTGTVTIARSSDPQLAWMSGLQAQWNPQVIDSGPGTIFAFKVRGNDGVDHYGGLLHLDTDNAQQYASMAATLPDGRTVVTRGLLEYTLKKRDLGVLASLLYHETQHFNFLQRDCAAGEKMCGWGSKTQDEFDSYKAQNRLADTFGLKKCSPNGSEVCYRDTFIEMQRQLGEAIKVGRIESFNPEPRDQKAWKGYYDNQQFNLADEYDRLKDEVNDARKEQDRLRDEAAAQRRQEEEHRKQAAARAALMASYTSALRGCYMEPLMIDGTDRTLGFEAPDEVEFGFTEPVDLRQAKGAMLLAYVCRATMNRQTPPGACTDILDELRSSWNDAGFMHGLELTSEPGEYADCVRTLRTLPHAPRGIDDLARAANRHWDRWRDNANHRAMLTEREFADKREEASRRDRYSDDTPANRGGRNHDDNWDLTPAYQALDRARRSHF